MVMVMAMAGRGGVGAIVHHQIGSSRTAIREANEAALILFLNINLVGMMMMAGSRAMAVRAFMDC